MTLRDYFAGQALGFFNIDAEAPDRLAFYCYQIADAMLKARNA